VATLLQQWDCGARAEVRRINREWVPPKPGGCSSLGCVTDYLWALENEALGQKLRVTTWCCCASEEAFRQKMSQLSRLCHITRLHTTSNLAGASLSCKQSGRLSKACTGQQRC